MPSTRTSCSLLLALALLLGLAACGGVPQKAERTIFAMGTVMLLTAWGENAEAGLAAAAAEIGRLDTLLDPEAEGSAVYRLNRGETVRDADLLSLAETCRAVCEASGGALDPTVYPLVKLWGFIGGDYRVPADEELAALLENVDYSAVTVSPEGVSLPAGAMLSFGASAKGYAAQRAAEAMAATGVESGVLSLGGNVQTLGTKPDGSQWTVGVQDPADPSAVLGTLSLGGGLAAVTSGGYQRFFEQDGKTYQHILDPKTGYPAESGLTGVTVVCADGARADALSTALFVLGEDGALALWRETGGFELLLVTADGRVVLTPELEKCFTAAKKAAYSVEIAG